MTCRKSLHPTENSKSVGSANMHEYAKYVQNWHQIATSCQSAQRIFLIEHFLLDRAKFKHCKLNRAVQSGKLLTFIKIAKNHAGYPPALSTDFSSRSLRSLLLCVHATS